MEAVGGLPKIPGEAVGDKTVSSDLTELFREEISVWSVHTSTTRSCDSDSC